MEVWFPVVQLGRYEIPRIAVDDEFGQRRGSV